MRLREWWKLSLEGRDAVRGDRVVGGSIKRRTPPVPPFRPPPLIACAPPLVCVSHSWLLQLLCIGENFQCNAVMVCPKPQCGSGGACSPPNSVVTAPRLFRCDPGVCLCVCCSLVLRVHELADRLVVFGVLDVRVPQLDLRGAVFLGQGPSCRQIRPGGELRAHQRYPVNAPGAGGDTVMAELHRHVAHVGVAGTGSRTSRILPRCDGLCDCNYFEGLCTLSCGAERAAPAARCPA